MDVGGSDDTESLTPTHVVEWAVDDFGLLTLLATSESGDIIYHVRLVSDPATEPPLSEEPTTPGVPTAAVEPAESDAAAEFRVPFPGPAWTRPDGSAADTRNEINLIVAPDHCDWESATMLHIPWPLDTVVHDSTDKRQYLWDPEGIFVDNGVADTGIVDRLPDDADFIGFHTAHQELWLAPSDQDEFAYLLDHHGTIRRLSRPDSPENYIQCE